MNPQDAIDLSREAIKTCMMVGGPILIISLLIGLLVGVFQAMTQVQDQTVSFVPKILLLMVAIGACLPWLTEQMTDFATFSFKRPYAQTSFATPVTNFDTPTDLNRSSFSSSSTETVSFPATERQSEITIRPTHFEKPPIALPPRMPNARSVSPQDNSKLISPFVLPHYRFSRVPKKDVGG